MRVLLFFDLPTLTVEQRKAYRLFRKSLIEEGFLMIQESVYTRICINRESARFLENRIACFAPSNGIIQTLIITEKQYASIKFITGEKIEDPKNVDERTVVI